MSNDLIIAFSINHNAMDGGDHSIMNLNELSRTIMLDHSKNDSNMSNDFCQY